MGGLILLILSIGMAADASNIGYDGDDVPGFAPHPILWFFFALFLPIIAIPVYLIRRPALKAAAEQRRLQARTMAALPGAVYSAHAAYGQMGNPYGPGGASPYPGAPQPPYPPQSPYAPPPPQAPYGGPPPQPPYGGPPPQAPYGGAPPYGAPPAQPPYGQAPAPPQAAEPEPTAEPEASKHASSSGSMTAGDLADGIRQLSDLRDRGLLTEAEFQARKAALLRKV